MQVDFWSPGEERIYINQIVGCLGYRWYKSRKSRKCYITLLLQVHVWRSSRRRKRLTCGVDKPTVGRAAILVVIVLLSVVVISSVRVFAVYVVIVVRVSGVPVCVAAAGMVSAPFPSVGGRDADVDGLRLWGTDPGGFKARDSPASQQY